MTKNDSMLAPIEHLESVVHLRCEAPHENTECSGRVVGYVEFACDGGGLLLACFNAFRWTLEGIEDSCTCGGCLEPCRDCWTAVMLP